MVPPLVDVLATRATSRVLSVAPGWRSRASVTYGRFMRLSRRLAGSSHAGNLLHLQEPETLEGCLVRRRGDDGAQLGKAYGSNNSGDGPSGEASLAAPAAPTASVAPAVVKCGWCPNDTSALRRACDACYEKCVNFPQDECAICHVKVQKGGRLFCDEAKATRMANFVSGTDGEGFYQSRKPFRDLRRWPLRIGECMCRNRDCLYRALERFQRRRKAKKRRPDGRGRPALRPVNGNCSVCGTPFKQTHHVRRVGGNTESMNVFFGRLCEKAAANPEETKKLSESSWVCNLCYMAWYNDASKTSRGQDEVGHGLCSDPAAVSDGPPELALLSEDADRDSGVGALGPLPESNEFLGKDGLLCSEGGISALACKRKADAGEPERGKCWGPTGGEAFSGLPAVEAVSQGQHDAATGSGAGPYESKDHAISARKESRDNRSLGGVEGVLDVDDVDDVEDVDDMLFGAHPFLLHNFSGAEEGISVDDGMGVVDALIGGEDGPACAIECGESGLKALGFSVV